ncbi:carbohydrate ABC transporter permease [Paenibacillus sp. FSL H7-0942]|jgi:putative aldouronate transport system permease protein|uniref:Binding-protein-dependent transport systems inner membrane component n=2 Tax=Paenibacillus TaxID=44249 RepID=A0A100VP16_PAEAM|nr:MULTISPECIES: carbohydrate ABC transporter permease [Paenibacillus]UOK62522.1 carbohydrate ABC transporter permease [Paenibacillus sp. OVF10]APO47230.1 sugar ABC transporter permease [Paenibacillus xylanexedens]ETT29910.1 binding-protein-dependent transport systems inner membrane component [Paenibacillus sp. FSL R5-192]ETT41907.1 binding-protein-dependent transport systems inner membrane component [Paenibacillus sp. FSL H7-689]KAA8748049.1 carbohydrate ABC transporter permease [Paenibacillu
MVVKHTGMDRLILTLNAIFLTCAVLVVVVPLIYIVIASFMDPTVLLNRGLSFNVSDWSLDGYQMILSNPAMIRGFANAVLYSVSFALITVTVSIFAGYALSDDRLAGRGFFMIIFIITMFFGGGLIPTYLLIRNLGMLDTVWAIIIPGAVNVWNIILSRTFFKGVPRELKEAANVDGASEMKIFFQIVIPLSKPIIFVLALYAFVGQWNSYFDAMIYLDNPNLHPLQLVLRSILIQNQAAPGMISDQLAMAELKRLSEMIKYSAIVISSLPLIIMYPFFQKYFEKGVMVGSLK